MITWISFCICHYGATTCRAVLNLVFSKYTRNLTAGKKILYAGGGAPPRPRGGAGGGG
jgi:hypothetical protein